MERKRLPGSDLPIRRFSLAAGILVIIGVLGMFGAEDAITYGAVTGLIMVVRETLSGTVISKGRDDGDE